MPLTTKALVGGQRVIFSCQLGRLITDPNADMERKFFDILFVNFFTWGEVQTQIDGAQVVSDLKFQFPQVGENPQSVTAVV